MDLQTTNKPRRVGDGTPGPGRPKGSKNKSTLQIKEAFLEAFNELGGVPALVRWGRSNDTDFYKLAARLIPTEQHISGPGGAALGVILVPHKQIAEHDNDPLAAQPEAV